MIYISIVNIGRCSKYTLQIPLTHLRPSSITGKISQMMDLTNDIALRIRNLGALNQASAHHGAKFLAE